MKHLRDPQSGCPWDIQQNFETIAPYTIEEAYEVADAIERQDMADLRDELGDLLFQVVFHSQMAEEIGAFSFSSVVESICQKMERRHPHVFGDQQISNAEQQTRAWEALKDAERRDKMDSGKESSALDGVSVALPALTRADKLQKRAARVGFDWPDAEPVFDKIIEELDEVREEIKARKLTDNLAMEIGDVLFAVSNLARHLGVDPETALRMSNSKFERRFRLLEKSARKKHRNIETCGLEELEALYQQVKENEKTPSKD